MKHKFHGVISECIQTLACLFSLKSLFGRFLVFEILQKLSSYHLYSVYQLNQEQIEMALSKPLFCVFRFVLRSFERGTLFNSELHSWSCTEASQDRCLILLVQIVLQPLNSGAVWLCYWQFGSNVGLLVELVYQEIAMVFQGKQWSCGNHFETVNLP